MPIDPTLEGVARSSADPLQQLTQRIADLERQLRRLDVNSSRMPTGACVPIVVSLVPEGWLLMNGQAVTPTWPILRQKLLDAGSPHGTSGADPRLPDTLGRVVLGAGAGAGLTARTLGQKAGAETVTLDVTQIPSHDHGGVTGNLNAFASNAVYGAGGGTNFKIITWGGNFIGNDNNKWVDLYHNHGISAQGGGLSHPNMPPWVALPWMVKT